MKKLMTILIYSFILLLLLPLSCAKGEIKLLEKETLFNIEYGRMEDQIDIGAAAENYSPRKNRITMQNGIFHISNGRSAKIMEFNSYGEILNLYYNSGENPEPVILTKQQQGEQTSTRNVYAYPFKDVGEIAIDSGKRLYIDDRIAENRVEHDDGLGVPLDRIILQFNQSGEYIDYLGQEGSGGTPFSYIEKIRISDRDELIVFTRNTQGWKIFWFSSEGRPLYIVDINSDALPFPNEEEKEHSFADLETIESDQINRFLYIKIDYYIDHSMKLDSEETGISFNNSVIWTLDISKGEYDEWVEIPSYLKEEDKPQVYEDETTNLLYEFIGTSGDGIFYLISLDGRNSYNLMLLNRNGQVIQTSGIDMGPDRLMIQEFYISKNGILTGLLGWEENMEVAWWRTDKFLGKEE
ncbi:MAG: hypothetical protein JEY99_13260 [Spirochaetales bacterium]|nr:hypothetical protein [Spirochaetales bacterium]